MKEESLSPPFTCSLTTKKLAALADPEIGFSDIPGTNAEWFAKARIVYLHERKQQLRVRLDADVARLFKFHGRGYQTRMNEVLRTCVQAMRKQGIVLCAK
jgi:uncharacterized protein (DUF4415 family)